MTRRKWILVVTGAVAAALILIAISMNPGRLVTQAAVSDARRLCETLPRGPGGEASPIFEFRLLRDPEYRNSLEDFWQSLADRYGFFFRSGYFDRDWIIRSLPRDGFTPETLPYHLVVMAFFVANGDKLTSVDFDGTEGIDLLIDEGLGWIRPLMASARAKETLVNLLIREYEPLEGRKEPAGLLKMALASTLLLNDLDDYGPVGSIDSEYRPLADHILGRLDERDWDAALRDTRHPSEKVRAGALLLLFHHPRKEVLIERACEGLADPSPLVRLAAASALAYHGNPTGRQALIDGLGHERWEIRWWCGKLLAMIGGAMSREAIARQQPLEPDAWVKKGMEEMLESFD